MSRFRWCNRECFILFVLFLVIGTVGTVVSVIYLGKRNPVQPDNPSTYNETVIIPYSSVWCSSISFEVLPFVGSKFYLLKTKPNLTDHDVVYVYRKDVFVVNEKFEYYSFYLHLGSNISFSVCSTTGLPLGATFKLVVGKDNFKKWQNDVFSDSSPYLQFSFDITTYCSESLPPSNSSLGFFVNESAEHYLIFVFKNRHTLIELRTLQIYRTKYRISTENVISYCGTQDDYPVCYLDVSYDDDYVALIDFHPPADVHDDDHDTHWLTNLEVTSHCTNKVLIYIGIFLVGFVSVFFVSLIFTYGCCCCLLLYKKYDSAGRFSFKEESAEAIVNYGSI